MNDARTPATAHLRLDAHGDSWMIATIDGTRLPATPIPHAAITATIGELVSRIGVTTHVEVHYANGQVVHALVDPDGPASVVSMLVAWVLGTLYLRYTDVRA